MNNLQYLATELFKVKIGLSQEMMKEIFIFQENESYSLRRDNLLARKNIQKMQYGTESISNWGEKIWDLLTGEINIVLLSSIPKLKLENGSQKNFHASLSDIYKTYILFLLYLIYLRQLLNLPSYFDWRFKSS